jgi:hypothetical protein
MVVSLFLRRAHFGIRVADVTSAWAGGTGTAGGWFNLHPAAMPVAADRPGRRACVGGACVAGQEFTGASPFRTHLKDATTALG